MNSEAMFKKGVKNSVEKQGGYALSLAAPGIKGTPDLYVNFPRYWPLMVEAKWLGEVKYEHWQRKIPITKLQMHTLQTIELTNQGTAFIMVGLEWRFIIYALMVRPPLGEKEVTLNQNFLDYHPHIIYNRGKGGFDFRNLLEQMEKKNYVNKLRA